MLRELRIQNFKGWQDTGLIRMAPITLFFGANSSGKSSIGQFLMMLKQTVESADRKTVLYPGGRNSAVQLGSFQDMVFHRNPENTIAFQYSWDIPKTMEVHDSSTNHLFFCDALSFFATVGLDEKDQRAMVLHTFKYKLLEDNVIDEIEFISIGMDRKSKSEYTVTTEEYSLKRKIGRPWSPGVPVRFYGFPDEVVAYYQNAEFVKDLNLHTEKLFRSLFYLGPLRTKTERLYSWTGIEPESVGYSGENTVAAILAARNRRISLGYRRPTKPFEQIIAQKLKNMGLIEDFSVKPISEQRQEYEVKLRTKGSRDFVDMPDVGFGISQVFPVLVQIFYAPPGSIIIMEQPEIHLHPSAQSALADVMIDAINAREDGEDRNIQLIIETHSEHFLRRLQRRIAENAIPQDKVSAYFADITKTPARLEPLELDLFGNISNWPENFFGDEMGDITQQAKAAMQRRMKETERHEEAAAHE